ncbi:hypothetical protein GIR35_12405 [Enterococcus faecalis]|nr:hypothetical protein GIR35_12405 [Enterococcus faecalis]
MNEGTLNKDGIIAAIREYENSVEMPADERVTYLDASNRVHLKAGDDKAPSFAPYAEKCREYLRFGDEVDLATCGAYESHNLLKLCNTPQIFLDAGFEQKPMLYTQRHLQQALKPKLKDDPHRHGLSIEQIKRLPQLFETPVLFADNPSREDAMLVVLCAVDDDKLPIIASVKPDGKGNYQLDEIETNMVLTVFGKKNFARYFELALSPDMILYLNKEKGQELERLSERLLLGDYTSLDLDTIIRHPQCIIKSKTSDQHDYKLESESKSAREASKKLAADSICGVSLDKQMESH